jgi:addiction module RelE/StbE family toxin
MRVAYTSEATGDLDRIHAYIAEQSPRAATAVSAAIRKLAEGLADFPFMGHPTHTKGVLVLTLRRYSFRIFYRLTGDEVQILHIRHDSRAEWQSS